MFTDLIHYLRARFQVEEGQTMAEYGVVLAVITVLIVGALLAPRAPSRERSTRSQASCKIAWPSTASSWL